MIQAVFAQQAPVARTGGPGDYVTHEVKGSGVRFIGRAGWVNVSFCTPEIVRVQSGLSGEAPAPDGPIVVKHDWPPVALRIDDLGDRIEMRSTGLEVDVRKRGLLVDFYGYGSRPLSLDTTGVEWQGPDVGDTRACDLDEHFYGFGLQLFSFDQRSHARLLKTNADPRTDTGESHVVSPFFMSTAGYGVYLNSGGYTRFRMAAGDPSTLSFSAPERSLDYYFLLGPEPRTLISGYTDITGRPRMPPLWALGFWYRARSDWKADRVEAVAEQYRKRHLPCDVIGLEPGWQTHAYPCSFQWNHSAFPDPEGFVKRLHAQGFKVNLWEHAYTAADSPLGLTLDRDGLVANRRVFGGLVPDFSVEQARDEFRAAQVASAVSLGIDGFKLDEDDGADYTGGWFFPDDTHFPGGLTGAQMHNLFGFLYQKTVQDLYEQKGQRTFLLCRGDYAGSQAYPVAAYSDTYDLKQYLRGLCDSGFTGTVWCPEVRQTGNAEEFDRRLELAFLSPVAMINAWQDGVLPWEKGPEAEAVFRKYSTLRMRLLPYLYSACWEAHQYGTPLVRPILMDHPDDRLSWHVEDEYMLGPSMLVAPVIAGDEREVYLPPGRWTDFWTGKAYLGGRDFPVKAPDDAAPIFVRDNGVVAFGAAVDHVSDNGESGDVVDLSIYAGKGTTHTVVYRDDGATTRYLKGEYAEMTVDVQPDGADRLQIDIDRPRGKYRWAQSSMDVTVHGLAGPPTAVRDNGHVVPASLSPIGGETGRDLRTVTNPDWSYDLKAATLVIRVPFGRPNAIRVSGAALTPTLGSTP